MRQTADPDTSGRKDAPLPDYGLFASLTGCRLNTRSRPHSDR